MKPKCIHLLLVVLVSFGAVVAQNEDELPNPLENDNQFPPENHVEGDDVVEGSGDGTVYTTTDSSPVLEAIQPTNALVEEASSTPGNDIPCPERCSCMTEADAFTVDCAGFDLTEFPSPIDEKTTVLKLRNNKLTEIPKSISSLKNLKVLDADNNSIMELKSGSISELPNLTVLKLANNRLIEYPSDLRNSLLQNKLEELDLGGNDMRTVLDADTFSNFESLRKLTLATSTVELKEDICNKLKNSLVTICTSSCGTDMYECDTYKPIKDEDELLLEAEAKLPGTLIDPEIPQETNDTDTESVTEETPAEVSSNDKANSEIASSVNNFSLRVAAENIPSEGETVSSDKPVSDTHQDATAADANVKIGANTSDTKTGGVDKSIIGIIVAAMVVVVAGVTIKKNWSSIKKRFSSSPRPANERVATGNGTAPEEVPLQDNKSPV
ncbi:uncharacterized protein LOC125230041 [Leguminivora glycinivorella]|uniref:uncharacterized protein LOC125230041 n=1 Tax=Leguminivora glycinivorella TaxID=1035111 RepID=UPI00200F5E10|nr:uncharacterized protein LOC125230041 [Leguminivora glycinivorella]